MSGIFGIFNLDGRQVEPNDLEGMLQRLVHRGPDGQHIWRGGHIGLGACQAHSTPESVNEPLPSVHASGLVLTGDVRLDYREGLLAALGLPGDGEDAPGDGELVILAYLHWGEDCLSRLVGDFAFVLWDSREQRLLAARDAFGVRPFYYYASSSVFAFASEIKALLALPAVPHQLNEARLAQYLLQTPGDTVTTLYGGIMRLPPGHALAVDIVGKRLWSYWSLDPRPEIRFRSDSEYHSAFRQIFISAVRCRLRSASPLGVALSGGLDSSSIAQVASQCFKEDGKPSLPVFSAVFPEIPESIRSQLDERSFIRAILQAGRYQPIEVPVDQISPFVDQEYLFRCQDQVYFAPTLAIYWAVYQAASQRGIRVYLEGIDGDLTVSHGLERFTELFLRGQWGRLIGEARALSAGGHIPKPASKIIWQYGIRPIIPPPLVDLKRALRGDRRPSELAFSLLQPDFARRVGISERTLDDFMDSPQWSGGARQEHWRSLVSPHIPLTLEMLDHVSAGLNIELRYPFFDRRLVEFCLAIPAEQKLSQGITRRVQRMAMAGILPEVVRWRNWKADFLVYFQDALLRHERARVDEVINKNNHPIQPYVNLATLRLVWEKYKSDPLGGLPEAGMVYAAVQLAAWLEFTGL